MSRSMDVPLRNPASMAAGSMTPRFAGASTRWHHRFEDAPGSRPAEAPAGRADPSWGQQQLILPSAKEKRTLSFVRPPNSRIGNRDSQAQGIDPRLGARLTAGAGAAPAPQPLS